MASPQTNQIVIPEHKVMFNHQLLGHVLSFLNLDCLKTCRLVCAQWAYEAGRIFPRIAIDIQTRHGDQEIAEIFSFLVTHRVACIFIVSPLPTPWYNCRPEDEDNYETLGDEYDGQHNDPDFGHRLTSALKITPSVGILVTELRLEVMLRDGDDAKFLGRILNQMQNLKRLCLDLVNYSDEGVQAIERGDIPPGITTLGLRVNGVKDADGVKSLQQASYTHLIELFPSLKFLDFDGWSGLFRMGQDLTKEIKCLAALARKLYPCPNFQGIRDDYVITGDACNSITAFPRPLKFLTVRMYQKDHRTVHKIGDMLRFHAPSLQELDLLWHNSEEQTLFEQKIDLPKYFPGLKSLKLKFVTGIEMGKIEGFVLDMMDQFSLRKIFLENKLQTSIPLLTHLQILVSSSVQNDFWDYIIPDCDKNGKILEIPQIKGLSISLITGDCGSVQITRFYKILPNLTRFQHVFKEGEKLYRCDHRIEAGRALNSKKSPSYVRLDSEEALEYGAGYIDCLVRPFLKISYSRQPCFWD
ncbi:uncharacterized protein LOC118436652 isoform X2 [Folsomia candida]|uniref:uncharacterized protein LOC118436652 isoform X2 n=1 Tax=Folsomia candida TaxID=158441 RepID=UPI001604FF80|nr:uncharacterized protein LOC118436652 isoform X2 [Folsomia candida]